MAQTTPTPGIGMRPNSAGHKQAVYACPVPLSAMPLL